MLRAHGNLCTTLIATRRRLVHVLRPLRPYSPGVPCRFACCCTIRRHMFPACFPAPSSLLLFRRAANGIGFLRLLLWRRDLLGHVRPRPPRIDPQPTHEHTVVIHHEGDQPEVHADGHAVEGRRASGDDLVQEGDLPAPVDDEATGVWLREGGERREGGGHDRRDLRESPRLEFERVP